MPLERIEYILNFTDKDGEQIGPVTIGLPPDLPQEVRNVVTFKAVGDPSTGLRAGKTEITVTEYGYTSDQSLELSKAGLEQCLDKMAAIFAL